MRRRERVLERWIEANRLVESTGLKSTLLAFSLVISGGCGSTESGATENSENATQEASPSEPPGVAETAVDDDPLAGLDDLEAIRAEIPDGPLGLRPPTQIPAGQCAAYDETAQRLWPRAGIAEVVPLGPEDSDSGFAIAGYARTEPEEEGGTSGEELFLLTVRPGEGAQVVLREDLERPLRTARKAPPGLFAIDAGHLAVAITDLGARVLFDVVQLMGRRATASRTGFRQVGDGADQRFQPTVGIAQGTRLVGYTNGRSDPTVAWLVRVDPTGSVVGRHDLTAPGTTSRTPVLTEDGHVVFVDARDGISTFWRSRLGPTGEPATPEVLRVVSDLFDPANYSIASTASGYALSYAAVGRISMTAVGLVRTDDPGMLPVAIVPSAGYGALTVDSTTSAQSVVFVADAPKAEERTAPRELRVRRALRTAPTELSEPLTLAGPDGTAFGATIARQGEDYAVVFGSTDGVYLHLLRCDESAP